MFELSCLCGGLTLLPKIDPIEYASMIITGVGEMRIPVGTVGSGTISCSCVAFDTVFTLMMVDRLADTK